jgi:hypothetical protein
VAQRTNVLSIVSLVLGIVSYFTGLFLGIGAIITGHIALGQLKKSGDKGRGFAIAGLILGYLGVLAGIVVTILLISFIAALGVASSNLNNSLIHPGANGSAPTSSAVPGGQTTAEACTVLQSQISDSITALNDNSAKLLSDPTAAVTALQTLSDDFTTAEKQIDNPDVLEASAQTQSALDTMIADIKAYIANPSSGTDAIVSDSATVGTSLRSLSSLCG